MSRIETPLADKRKYEETWRVQDHDLDLVERRISKDCREETLSQNRKILDQQIALAKKLTADELRQIVLFQEKEEREKEIVYRRPYIEGETLADKLKSGPFKTPDAIELILKIGRIISSAHKKGIVHGDLKPENIVIARDGSSVCIIDWETMKINRKIGDAQHVTMTLAELMGTPEYMAPEQFEEDHPVTQQSDVYALGLILYAMLAGKTPFAGMSQFDFYETKKSDIGIDSQHTDFQIDHRLAETIEDALKAECNFRIQSVSVFLNRVDQCSREDAPVKPQSFLRREETVSNVPIDNPTPQDKTKKYDFVLIGHSGAGKTVLAAGLYSYADEAFSVEADSPQTRKNADNLKTRLISHQWPDHTARGGSSDFTFFIFKNQENVASICFPEYAGEDIDQPRYCDDYLRNADAVALLLNPDILEKSILERNDRMSKLKECITYLSRLPVVPPVAFLITASDRLETDFSDRKDEFEKYANEIMVSLNSKKVPSKRFDVSVTGKLESQDRADLKPVDVDAPFIWLLDQLEQREKKRSLCRFCKRFGLPAAIGLVALCCVLLGIVPSRSKGKKDATASVRTEQTTSSESKDVSPATQEQTNATVTDLNADHTDEIKKVDPTSIAAVKTVVSKYQDYPKDKEALVELIKKSIASRLHEIDARFNRLSLEDKNNWRKLSEILEKGINQELKSIADSFSESKNFLTTETMVYQQAIVNTFITAENIKAEKNQVGFFDIATDSKLFISANKETNPYVDYVSIWFFTKVSSSCQSFYNKDPRMLSKQNFIDIKELCEAVVPRRGDPFPSDLPIANAWKNWCRKYLEWKDDNKQYTIEFRSLQARVKYSKPDDPYFGTVFIYKNKEKILDFTSMGLSPKNTRFDRSYKPFETAKLPSPKLFELGDCLSLYAEVMDEDGIDHAVDSFNVDYYPGIDDPRQLERIGNNSDIKLDLGVSPYSQCFSAWKHDNPLPKQ